MDGEDPCGVDFPIGMELECDPAPIFCDQDAVARHGVDLLKVPILPPKDPPIAAIDPDHLEQGPLPPLPLTNPMRTLVGQSVAAGARVVMTSAQTQPLADDYHGDWLMKGHIMAFPNGTGGRPVNMSEKRYNKLILQRFPASQTRHDPMLPLSMLNQHQRHVANTHASICLTASPAQASLINGMSEADYTAMLKVIASGARGAALGSLLKVCCVHGWNSTWLYGSLPILHNACMQSAQTDPHIASS